MKKFIGLALICGVAPVGGILIGALLASKVACMVAVCGLLLTGGALIQD
jgi:hypothetical protein